jgi:hypothetical protein
MNPNHRTIQILIDQLRKRAEDTPCDYYCLQQQFAGMRCIMDRIMQLIKEAENAIN